MSSCPAVVPLDPDSPAGIAAAARISRAFAEIEFAIWKRSGEPPRPSAPRPTPPPKPIPKPTGPRPGRDT